MGPQFGAGRGEEGGGGRRGERGRWEGRAVIAPMPNAMVATHTCVKECRRFTDIW